MPRAARATESGIVDHVLNRGNGRMRLFYTPGDYEAFKRVFGEGLERYPVALLTYCLMPNPWHLVVRPHTDESLGRWMGWVGVTHVRRRNAFLALLVQQYAERPKSSLRRRDARWFTVISKVNLHRVEQPHSSECRQKNTLLVCRNCFLKNNLQEMPTLLYATSYADTLLATLLATARPPQPPTSTPLPLRPFALSPVALRNPYA